MDALTLFMRFRFYLRQQNAGDCFRLQRDNYSGE